MTGNLMSPKFTVLQQSYHLPHLWSSSQNQFYQDFLQIKILSTFVDLKTFHFSIKVSVSQVKLLQLLNHLYKVSKFKIYNLLVPYETNSSNLTHANLSMTSLKFSST